MKLMHIVALQAIFITSCCDVHKQTKYKYKDVIIYRVDECGKTIFYYNSIDNNAIKLWVEYSGINDGFSGYLKFDQKGEVTFLSGDGYFQTEKKQNSKFKYSRILAHQRPALNKNIYYINLSISEEKKGNNSNTEVVVEYK